MAAANEPMGIDGVRHDREEGAACVLCSTRITGAIAKLSAQIESGPVVHGPSSGRNGARMVSRRPAELRGIDRPERHKNGSRDQVGQQHSTHRLLLRSVFAHRVTTYSL